MPAIDKIYTVQKSDLEGFIAARGISAEQYLGYHALVADVVNPEHKPVNVFSPLSGANILPLLMLTRSSDPSTITMLDMLMMGDPEKWENYSPKDFDKYVGGLFEHGKPNAGFETGLYPFLLGELLLVDGRPRDFSGRPSDISFKVDQDYCGNHVTEVRAITALLIQRTPIDEGIDIYYDKGTLKLGISYLVANLPLLNSGAVVVTDYPMNYLRLPSFTQLPTPEALIDMGAIMGERGKMMFGYSQYPLFFRYEPLDKYEPLDNKAVDV